LGVATELGGNQVASLLETLPGIASVLRNPVADAFVGLIRAGARLTEFKVSDAEEILRYAVRRTLMTQDETDRVLAEVRVAADKRAERAAERLHNAAERLQNKVKKPIVAPVAIVRPKAKVAVAAPIKKAVKPAKVAVAAKKKKR
jgi:outer membrane translocation and assembly module TamA